MTAKTNLTFTEVNTAAPTPIFTYDAGESDVLLSLKALTGDTYAGLSDSKVLKSVKRYLDVCKDAQDAANVGLDEGELLDTFNASALALNETTNTIELRTSQDFTLDLADASVSGQNI